MFIIVKGCWFHHSGH